MWNNRYLGQDGGGLGLLTVTVSVVKMLYYHILLHHWCILIRLGVNHTLSVFSRPIAFIADWQPLHHNWPKNFHQTLVIPPCSCLSTEYSHSHLHLARIQKRWRPTSPAVTAQCDCLCSVLLSRTAAVCLVWGLLFRVLYENINLKQSLRVWHWYNYISCHKCLGFQSNSSKCADSHQISPLWSWYLVVRVVLESGDSNYIWR